MSGASSPFREHHRAHSEKSAISLSWKVLPFPTVGSRVIVFQVRNSVRPMHFFGQSIYHDYYFEPSNSTGVIMSENPLIELLSGKGAHVSPPACVGPWVRRFKSSLPDQSFLALSIGYAAFCASFFSAIFGTLGTIEGSSQNLPGRS
jgi:hypothetical protein